MARREGNPLSLAPRCSTKSSESIMSTVPQRGSVDDDPVEKGDDLGKPITPIQSNGHGTTVEYTSDSTHAFSEVETNLRAIDEAVDAIGFGKFQW